MGGRRAQVLKTARPLGPFMETGPIDSEAAALAAIRAKATRDAASLEPRGTRVCAGEEHAGLPRFVCPDRHSQVH